MSNATPNTGAGTMDPKDLLGLTEINGTTYQVYHLPVGPNSARAGMRANFALVGPRGASYLVTDHGPRFELNSVAVGGDSTRPGYVPAPRPLRGLRRSDLAAFGVEA